MAVPDRGQSALTMRTLGVPEGLSIALVTCSCNDAAWAPPEVSGGPSVVFVRRGAFGRQADGVETLIDATMVYFERPGVEERFAHYAGHGDECLSISMSDGFVAELGLSPAELPVSPIYTSATIDLAHRRLARRACLVDDGFEVYERTARLVFALIERSTASGRSGAVRPSTTAARQRLVARAREALLSRPAIGLAELSRQVGSSPHHLSRIFAGETGQTLSAYRNRLRVGLALVQLERGERDLAGLAAELGFADHAHMSRVVRAQLDQPPSRLRNLLSAAD